MSFVRIFAAVVVLAGCFGTPLSWADRKKPMSAAQKQKVRTECQRGFDQWLDDCMKQPNAAPNQCLEGAAAYWQGCMDRYGLATRPGERPPGYTGVSTGRPQGQRPAVAPVTPTPSKRKEIDSGAAGEAKPVKSATPTPLGSPKRVPKKTGAPSIKRDG